MIGAFKENTQTFGPRSSSIPGRTAVPRAGIVIFRVVRSHFRGLVNLQTPAGIAFEIGNIPQSEHHFPRHVGG